MADSRSNATDHHPALGPRPSAPTRNVGILIFPNVELLDFAGPFEVFSAAMREGAASSLFNVFTVAEKPEPLRAWAGLTIVPDYTFENCPKIDILVVPGGQGTRTEITNQRVIDWIASVSG